ncbi:MAG: (Fe-S)-binding protein [Desulfobacteraceae bacterium]
MEHQETIIDPAKFPPFEPDGEAQVAADAYDKAIRMALKKYAKRPVMAMMDACIDCGQCAQACHYYASVPDDDLIPAVKARRLTNLLRKYFHPVRSRLGIGTRPSTISEGEFQSLFDAAFRNCTLCGKCAISCPMGINCGEILDLARCVINAVGKAPEGLVSPVVASCREGNYIGMSNADFIENMEWIGEEMVDEFELDEHTVPIDKPGAEILYVPHPLEVRDLPFLLMYALRTLDASGINYTLSSEHFDTVNYAYYQGSKENMMRIARRMIQTAQKMGVKQVILAPCGHGFRVMKWEAERYLKEKLPFSVHTIPERVAHYIKTGQLKLKTDTIKERVTFHDPCNVARRGGVVQAPRDIIQALGADFVEMHPHGVANYCCGGGGGLGATAEFGKVRMSMGRAKAEQIRQTGAKIVITSCFNCLTQIRSLNQEYDLGIEVKNILELVAYAIET